MALPFFSSTRSIPDTTIVPRHIAIIMDGNGRWAKQRFMPRVMGHQRGVETVREMVRACRQLGVEDLTLFAFSSENAMITSAHLPETWPTAPTMVSLGSSAAR